MMARPLRIAGIGNLFLGDDAFGCEVLRRLCARCPEPRNGVELRDFGASVRAFGYWLAERCAAHSCGTTVIVDAVATGSAPGTIQLFDLGSGPLPESPIASPHAHGLNDALTTAVTLGASLGQVYLLGCEPASFEPAEDCLLSPAVELAAQRCVDLLRRFIMEPSMDLITLTRYAV
jgi:hydrogenase maturation protease